MFPNEIRELSGGLRAAQKTEVRAGGLHKKAGCGKGRGGLQKRAALRPALSANQLIVQPALVCSPLARPVVQWFSKCSVRSTRAPREKPRGPASYSFVYVFIFINLLWGSVNHGKSRHGLHNTKNLRTPAVVQSAGPPFCAARQPTENSCFSFGNTALQPARPSV